LLQLAWPLILSNGLGTMEIVVNRVFLSQWNPDAVAAATTAALLFLTPFSLLQNTANYVNTFVAQYTGAGQHRRVGPAVWQAIYFSVASGLAMPLLAPLAPAFFALGGHSPDLQRLEVVYFQCLCFSALPMLISSSVCGFFAGRGDSRTVLFINATGLGVNALLAYALIFGRWGFPEIGIAGAGWATIAGASASAAVAMTLMLLPRYRERFATASGWRFDAELFRRTMRFGLPNGLFMALDTAGFSIFFYLVAGIGKAEAAASSIVVTLNLIALQPLLGFGLAVEVLVGQRLGESRPDLAERSTWTGLGAAGLFTLAMASAYVLLPDLLALPFRSEAHPEEWNSVRELTPSLLRFVAAYCLFDCGNLIFSSALRGAGDTRFVTGAAVGLSAGVLVLPTWLSLHWGGGLYAAWTCVSLYVILLALTFFVRFRRGAWKSMRVIEAAPSDSSASHGPNAAHRSYEPK
jgi:MATE family multidrug resistance protein